MTTQTEKKISMNHRDISRMIEKETAPDASTVAITITKTTGELRSVTQVITIRIVVAVIGAVCRETIKKSIRRETEAAVEVVRHGIKIVAEIGCIVVAPAHLRRPRPLRQL